jgi:HK97 family phage major capsid protein
LCFVDNVVLDDFIGARQIIEQELLAGLINAENEELLNGTGAGHIEGLIASAEATPVTRTSLAEPYAETVHRAVTVLRSEAFSEPDGIVMNPADVEVLRFAKVDTAGSYLVGDPLAADPGRLWGVPLVVTTRIPAGIALVGAFQVAAGFFVRVAPVLELNPWHQDAFEKNQVVARCEERLALGIPRPGALCAVDFTP